MRKAIFYLGGVALLAACAKKSYEPPRVSSNVNRIRIVEGSALQGGIVPMNESFSIQNKGVNLSYIYKGYSQRPNVNGKILKATSVASIDNYIFVSWHAEGRRVGGAISAYERVGDQYEYRELMKFLDTDWYDLKVEKHNGEYILYAGGQRDIDFSDYSAPKDHKGAVLGRVIYQPNNQYKFLISEYKEMALPNVATNGVEIDADEVIAVTGAAGATLGVLDCGIYKASKSFENVSEKFETSYPYNALAAAPPSGVKRYAALSDNGLGPWLVGFNDIEGSSLKNYTGGGNTSLKLPLNERTGLVWENDQRVITGMGNSSLLAIDFSTGSYFTSVAELGGSVMGVDVDRDSKLVYCATAEGGLQVLAGSGFSGGWSKSYDILGKFSSPSGTNGRTTNLYAQNIAVHNGNQLTLTSGEGGIYFIQKS